MDIQANWEKAVKNTHIIRARIKPLATFAATEMPYIFLAESAVNPGDTVIRRGKILVEKPSIILPYGLPQFGGFDFDKEGKFNEDTVLNFLIVRGVNFPSLKYNNETASLDIYEGKLEKAMAHYADRLSKEEDVHTGLITGPEACWQFSVLIFTGWMVARSAPEDIKKFWDDFLGKAGG